MNCTEKQESTVYLQYLDIWTTEFAAITLRFESRCEKTGLQGFRSGPTQTRLYSYRRWL